MGKILLFLIATHSSGLKLSLPFPTEFADVAVCESYKAENSTQIFHEEVEVREWLAYDLKIPSHEIVIDLRCMRTPI